MRCLAAVMVLASGAALGQSAAAPGSYLDVLSKGEKLTAAEAEGLESALRANREDIETRGKLVAYYFLNLNREPWARHVFWVIEYHPEAALAGYNFAIVPATPGLLSEEADAARARSLWLDAVKRRGEDGRVLANAAVFFSQPGGDKAAAEDLLKRLAEREPNNAVWKERVAAPGRAESAPPARRSPGSEAITDVPTPVQRIRIGGAVMEKNLITKVMPVYPPEPLRIQGAVRFTAIIGKDGHVENLQLVSGHPLLVPAALEAVRQYVYEVVLVNGLPVQVITQIDVPFTLDPTFRETPVRKQAAPLAP